MSVFRISRHPIKSLLSLSQSLNQTRYTSNSKKFKKLKEMQARMQCDDGVPIYLKKGTPDNILFGLSTILIICGGIGVINLVWRSAQK